MVSYNIWCVTDITYKISIKNWSKGIHHLPSSLPVWVGLKYLPVVEAGLGFALALVPFNSSLASDVWWVGSEPSLKQDFTPDSPGHFFLTSFTCLQQKQRQDSRKDSLPFPTTLLSQRLRKDSLSSCSALSLPQVQGGLEGTHEPLPPSSPFPPHSSCPTEGDLWLLLWRLSQLACPASSLLHEHLMKNHGEELTGKPDFLTGLPEILNRQAEITVSF